ncbi:MAG: cysteine hydrolase family protein [Candidatus Aminicenantia bacterium]
MREALLIIDMLNDFVKEGAPLEVPDTRKIIPFIKKEIEEARNKGTFVIYVCDAHDPDDIEFKKYGWPPHAIKGTEGAQVVEELKPREGDIIVEKKTYSGFYKTELEEILRKLGVDTVRMTGCVTHICILFTASDASLRNFNVVVLKDGIAGISKEDHEAGLRIMQNVVGVKIE